MARIHALLRRAYPREDRAEGLRQLERALGAGGQAYVVCPTVEESDESELRAATTTFEELRTRFAPAGIEVGLVHGRLAPDERQEAMESFGAGRTRVLVATTVI